MERLTEWLGLAGTAVVAIAYLPQILHLVRAHCSAGVSIAAWSLWATADLMIGSHAVAIGDTVFIALGAGNATAALLIIALAWKYRGDVCEAHRRHEASDFQNAHPRVAMSQGLDAVERPHDPA
jgi:uncharacterized protein with PQ loop repeat